MRGRWRGNNGKRAVIAGDADSPDSDGLSGGKTVRGGGCDRNEETVFGCAAGAGGDRDRCWLSGTARTRGNGNDHVFIDNGRAGAGAALADAIEIRVVELARKVVAGFSVADSEVFPAEKCRGIRVGVGRKASGDTRERAWSCFLVEHAIRVQQHGAQRGVQRFVGFDVVDRRIGSERTEEGLQTGPRGHAAVAEDDVLAIGRDSVRKIRRRHVRHQPTENFNGRVL